MWYSVHHLAPLEPLCSIFLFCASVMVDKRCHLRAANWLSPAEDCISTQLWTQAHNRLTDTFISRFLSKLKIRYAPTWQRPHVLMSHVCPQVSHSHNSVIYSDTQAKCLSSIEFLPQPSPHWSGILTHSPALRWVLSLGDRTAASRYLLLGHIK